MGIGTFEKLPADKKEMILSTGIREFSQKAYKDVSTDSITQKCHISKGILFHYFGSKKGYYMYCLEASLERLMSKTLCEWIGNEHIQALTQELFEFRYNKTLEEILQNKGTTEKYYYILKEFGNGNIERNHSRGTLLNNKEWIPLKNRIGK